MNGRVPRLSVFDRLLVGLVGALGPLVLHLLARTWRIEVRSADKASTETGGSRAVVYAFWHGQMLPLEYIYRGRGIYVLTSWHRDGEMVARVMTKLGFGVVRGSTSRGSVRGLLRMMAKASEGAELAVTPDGPRGPAGVVKRGVLYLAERTGAVIAPMGVGASRATRLSSWDGFMIPSPFSRVVVCLGDPLVVRGASDLEAYGHALKRTLDALTAEAEALAVRTPAGAAAER
jgi:lysophospholipid acyltransferase (LPLAT)-like uncharacterized protein